MALLRPSSVRSPWRTLWRRPALWLAAALLCGLAQPLPAAEAGDTTDEYKVKAADLYLFARYVEWPAATFAAKNSPIVIGVLGTDPFGSYLDEYVRGEKVDDRILVVKRLRKAEDAAGCHILFISRSEESSLPRILPGFKGKSVLTVGDVDTFTREGGLIEFFIDEKGSVRLKIDNELAQAASLSISSKILRFATIVTPPRPGAAAAADK